jgi:hypothetical protein
MEELRKTWKKKPPIRTASFWIIFFLSGLFCETPYMEYTSSMVNE